MEAMTPQAEADRAAEWRCFNCGEVFTDRALAADHFGTYSSVPVCGVPYAELARTIRHQQELIQKLHDSDMSTSSKEFHALGARHHVEKRQAEEDGYAKGLADGRAEAAEKALREIHKLAVHRGTFASVDTRMEHAEHALTRIAEFSRLPEERKP